MGKPIIAIVNSFTQFVPGHVPVSYAQLDVYKRQILWWSWWGTNRQDTLAYALDGSTVLDPSPVYPPQMPHTSQEMCIRDRCSSDDEYAEYAVPAFKALNGRAMFIVAGAPACMDDLKAAGIENFIHVRVRCV